MNKFFRNKKPHWLLLPLLSGVLLALSFYPFGFSLLIFVSFAPLIYFVVAMPERSIRELFIGGFIVGSVSALSFSYPFFTQFHWLEKTYLFEDIIRLFFIPAAIIGGVSHGAITVFTRSLAGHLPVRGAIVFSALFTLWLSFFQYLMHGFNYFDPAFAAAPASFFLKFAAAGGTPLVVFATLLINSFLALLFVKGINKKKIVVAATVFSVAAFGGIVGYWRYLETPVSGENKILKAAIIQISDRRDNAFGSVKNGVFSYPLLEKHIKDALAGGADFIIYPFSPVSGAISASGDNPDFNKKVLVTNIGAIGSWVKENVPQNKIFMSWNSVYENKSFFNEYSFWKNGGLYARYQKRILMPFADYTPDWAAKKGLYTTPFDTKEGEITKPISLDGYLAGNLLCSEIGNKKLAREDAKISDFIIAAGSDAMFFEDVAGRINLVQAQYRAAENNIPVIRANRLGPSAFINPDGTMAAKMEYNKDGVVFGEVSLGERKKTFYEKFGGAPFLLLLAIIVLLPMRRKTTIV